MSSAPWIVPHARVARLTDLGQPRISIQNRPRTVPPLTAPAEVAEREATIDKMPATGDGWYQLP
eukprot:2048399-Amphidinium_carterae.1